MKRIICQFRAGSSMRHPFPIALLLILVAGVGARASLRPQYGGTLRVQMSQRVVAMDPRRWPLSSVEAAAAERVDALVFDRLLRFDDRGMLRPALAISWQHDALAKRWQFRIRDGAKFSDGTPLTPEMAALALQQILGNDFDVSATSDSVVIQAGRSLPNFPEQLATGRYFIFHTATDGSLSGTGPFLVADWPAADAPGKASFVANESCWAGRPFVDRVEVVMGVDSQKQANAIALGQADVVEVPAAQVRRAAQRGVRTASSDPVELFALVFDSTRPAVQDQRIRQAISLTIDRASIADVVLQRQGVPAGGLLPNWLSGYAFLFPASSDLPRAKKLLAATGREVSHPAPLALVYDSGDAEARAAAERVAVNLRVVGITVQVSEQIAGDTAKSSVADARLVRLPITEPDPATALAVLLTSLGEANAAPETLEQTYAAERAPIDAFRVIPLVHASESYGLGPQVRDWMAPRWGGWRLEDVWLAPAPAAGGTTP